MARPLCFEFSILAEPVAVEGAIVTEALAAAHCGRCGDGSSARLLGAPASSEFLASELYKAHVEIDKLKEQLREKPSPVRPRPRGRAPEDCTWDGMARAAIDGSKGVWLHTRAQTAASLADERPAKRAARASAHEEKRKQSEQEWRERRAMVVTDGTPLYDFQLCVTEDATSLPTCDEMLL